MGPIMAGRLERFEVLGLHGTSKTISARISDNTLILVGENGSGKTTLLRILYGALTGDLASLYRIPFQSIRLTIDGVDTELQPPTFEEPDLTRLLFRRMAALPVAIRAQMQDLLTTTGRPDSERLALLYDLLRPYWRGPASVLRTNLQRAVEGVPEPSESAASDDTSTRLAPITDRLKSKILYLPTFRRIEEELTRIYPLMYDRALTDDIQWQREMERRRSSLTQIVAFGMQDVDTLFQTETGKIQTFQSRTLRELTLRHFSDILSSSYSPQDTKRVAELSNETIDRLLQYADDTIVDTQARQSWYSELQRARGNDAPSDRDMIICHYFLKILHFRDQLETMERPITSFCDICNHYLVDKELVYDSSTFGLHVKPKTTHGNDGKPLPLSDLSSGEKQVVSLFSHLYLSGNEKCFLIIDEPELSLSVPWQRRFLVDIRRGDFCSGLVAATHSPFTYDNELREYAHSLGEFTSS